MVLSVSVAFGSGCSDDVTTTPDGDGGGGGVGGDVGGSGATGGGDTGGAGGVGGDGGAGGVPCTPSPLTDVVAEYHFSGDASDTSGLDHHGVVSGPTLTTDKDGVPDEAYEFHGAGEVISVPHAPDLSLGVASGAFTVAAWVYPIEQKTQSIVRKGPAVNAPAIAPYGLALSATGDVIGSIASSTAEVQVRKTGYDLDTWMHVAMTWDGTTVSLYVNAKLEDSTTFAGPINDVDADLLIGTRLLLPADTFNGKIDEIRLIEAVRSSCDLCDDAGISGTPECP